MKDFSLVVDAKRCHTIFYQGIFCSQTQLANYTKAKIKGTTQQYFKSHGKNNYNPLDVIFNVFLGKEISDVNLTPFTSLFSYLNLLTLTSTTLSKFINWYLGIEIEPPEQEQLEDLRAHSINISEISIGQETDINSHLEKYLLWKKEYPNKDLVLYGVSRGAATTFNAFCRFKYPEVKLVILEGCFFSVEDILRRSYLSMLTPLVNTGLKFFTKYNPNGPSPGNNLSAFPPNVPVVFITSEKDNIVPASSTRKLAQGLADQLQNDVYLLELKNSPHPIYMYQDPIDRENYENFIHAIYQKYGIAFPINEEAVKKGAILLETCQLTKDPSIKLSA